MDKFEIEDELKMLDKIYNLREEEIKINDEELKKRLNGVTLSEIEQYIENNISNKETKESLLTKIELLADNYEMKMANCLEKGYKQGFKDAMNLIVDCRNK